MVVAERLSARHLILPHALGQHMYVCMYVYLSVTLCMYVCMYICLSRSSTHAREDGGGVTRERTCAIRSSSRVGWMAEVRLKETEERLQHLQQCVPVSTPRLFTCVSICYAPSTLSFLTQCYLLREAYVCALCV